MKKLLLAMILGMLSIQGCGPEAADAQANSPYPSFELVVQLPAILTRSGVRYENFKHRVAFLEMTVRTKAGYHAVQKVLPADWSSVAIGALSFPKALDRGKDRLELKVRVWDRVTKGGLRSYPVAVGSLVVQEDEVYFDRTNLLVVPLRLKVAAESFDR